MVCGTMGDGAVVAQFSTTTTTTRTDRSALTAHPHGSRIVQCAGAGETNERNALDCVSGSHWGGRAVVVGEGGAAAGAWWAERQGRGADHGGAGQRQRMAAVLDDDACRSGAA